MLRIFAPFILMAVFTAWVLYRAFVKKDLRQHRNSLYLGLTFTAIWGIIYLCLFWA